LPLPEKQGVGSSILPLATIKIGFIAIHKLIIYNDDQGNF